MKNMVIWDDVKTPPETALRLIPEGRLKGKHDINPIWRIQKMTEIFGPCGLGWGYTIEKLWTAPGANGEEMCFAQVTLWYRTDGETCYIPGSGGSKLIEKTKNYMFTNDDGFKMAVTDAVGVAMKHLGVGADVYAGRTKYDTPPKNDTPEPILQPGNFSVASEAILKTSNLKELGNIEVNLKFRAWTEEEKQKLKEQILIQKRKIIEEGR